MEPLFVNSVTVDKEALNEWYAVEFRRFHKGYQVFTLVLAGLCLGVAIAFGYAAITTGLSFFWFGAVLVVVLVVVLVANLMLRHRIYVWALLRSEEGQSYPAHITTLFYEDELVLLRLKGAENAPEARQYAEGARRLRAEFTALEAGVTVLEATEADAAVQLRGQLGELKARLDALNGVAYGVTGERRLGYDELVNCLCTKRYVALYLGNTAALVDRTGFSLRDDAAFSKFIYGKLSSALAAATDKKTRSDLAAALRDCAPGAAEGDNKEETTR